MTCNLSICLSFLNFVLKVSDVSQSITYTERPMNNVWLSLPKELSAAAYRTEGQFRLLKSPLNNLKFWFGTRRPTVLIIIIIIIIIIIHVTLRLPSRHRDGVEAQIYLFVIPKLDGVARSRQRPSLSSPRMESLYPLHRRKGGPRDNLDLCGEDEISCLNQVLNPEPSSMWQIAIHNALFRPPTTTTTTT
jgi:hypothetical protein